jgi:tetratricopeptide (TPR) repeat protein
MARHQSSAGTNIDALVARAVALHHAGKLEAAGRLYRRILAMRADHPGALSGLGMIECQRRRFDRATALLEKAAAMAGDNPGYAMNLGAVYDAAGKFDRAAASYARAIRLAPRYADPYYNLGALHLLMGRPEHAIEVFDACMAAIGRDYHALAYKAHALRDADRQAEADYLLDYDRFIRTYEFAVPDGYSDLDAFDQALATHVAGHPTLRANVMSTMRGKHTGELLRDPKGPMAAMEPRIQQAIAWYIEQLPADPLHPAVRFAPRAWKLTSWGVVMQDGGHERSHIHPRGWLSGVFYVELPDLIGDPAREHEGWLQFGRPTPELHINSAPVTRDYQPGYGRIVLFPSYFYHGTIPFRSRQRRVCVSFDVEPLDVP